MGMHADLIAADLDGIDPEAMRGHLRAVAEMTDRQLAGMLGWLQQEQDPAYHTAWQLHQAREQGGIAAWREPPPDDAATWFARELQFAIDAHEFPDDLNHAIYGGIFAETEGDFITDDQYARAAQLIACRRNTCGGPDSGHRHTSPESAKVPMIGPYTAG